MEMLQNLSKKIGEQRDKLQDLYLSQRQQILGQSMGSKQVTKKKKGVPRQSGGG
jgi:hypothetical protein